MWQVRKPARNEEASEEAKVAAQEEHRLVTIGDAGAFAKRDKHTDLKVELHQKLLDLINLQALEQMSREQIEAEVGDIVREQLAKQNQALNNAERKLAIKQQIDRIHAAVNDGTLDRDAVNDALERMTMLTQDEGKEADPHPTAPKPAAKPAVDAAAAQG